MEERSEGRGQRKKEEGRRDKGEIGYGGRPNRNKKPET
jgi:hypothetical protein